MKYFFVTGERSGDQHAARLATEIFKRDFEAEIIAVGGKALKNAGAQLVMDYNKIAYMGILDVLLHLWDIKKAFGLVKRSIKTHQPDVLVLVDSPGFNLKIAKYGKKAGIKTCYYISPKVWVWRAKRVKIIKRYVDKMMTIFPFETEFYSKRGFHVDYVGNPVVEEINNYTYDPSFEAEEDITKIAVLPGSRKQELAFSTEIILVLAQAFPNCQFWIAAVDNLPANTYHTFEEIHNVRVFWNKTYDILKNANVAIVTSGTATLETAFLNCPQVVVYKTHIINWVIGKRIVNPKWISLVNIIADKSIIKELLQNDCTIENIQKEVIKILNDPQYCAEILHGYQQIKESIGFERASLNASKVIENFLTE